MPNPADMNTESIIATLREVLRWESQTLLAMESRIDERAAAVVSDLAETSGRIVVTGMGKMGLIGRKAAATFSSTGSPSIYLHPSDALHGDLGIVGPSDIMLALSNSGETEEVLALLPYMHRVGVKVIALTGRSLSSLAQRSHRLIDISIEREADEISSAPTASTTVALAVCDALAVALMRFRGFTREQFAIFHPGGHLGRKMLTTVADVMKTRERIPNVPSAINLRDAIVVMSQKGLGCVFGVDSQGRLEGVFTDGDLRRTLERYENPLAHSLTDCLVREPKSVKVSMLAAEALHLMEKNSITVLPVLDDQGCPVGALHLHDLVQLGLA